MDKKYVCYCGLYCENCAVKVKVEPAAKCLYDEMKSAGFEEVISFIPGGEGFWSFLKGMTDDGICISCRDGGGDPGCVIRVCAKEKGVEICTLCDDYPCDKVAVFLERHPALDSDNALLRNKGWATWSVLQDERMYEGYTYQDERQDR